MVRKVPFTEMKSILVLYSFHHINTEKVADDHWQLREKLQSKGYIIVDEFVCKGFNINSFLKHVGGMNIGRPNAGDLKHAEEFAQKLKQHLLMSKTES